jgi:GNAT superfamily N-acetyltransferase
MAAIILTTMEARVDWLETADAGLVERITDLINVVYEAAEKGLWQNGFRRTTPDELASLVAAGQIATATREGEPVGAIHVEDLEDDAAIFGMLAADIEHRSIGVGRALVDFAEQESARNGLTTMRLELLVPIGWDHPSKEFLKRWYGRRGYEVVRTGSMEDLYPHLALLLACPCDLLIYEKPL